MQKLTDPIRRDPLDAALKVSDLATDWRELPKPTSEKPYLTLFELLRTRESRRSFGEVNIALLGQLLWWSQRRTAISSENRDVCRTPIPTAGGIASVQTLIVSPNERPWIYDSRRHLAGLLPAEASIVESVLEAAEEFMPVGKGRLLVFYANREFVEHYYQFPESLVLREAGALMGLSALLCEQLELAYCPLGTQAHDWASRLLGLSEKLVIPGGAAVVGSR